MRYKNFSLIITGVFSWLEIDTEETRNKIVAEDRVLIRIEIERVGPQNRG